MVQNIIIGACGISVGFVLYYFLQDVVMRSKKAAFQRELDKKSRDQEKESKRKLSRSEENIREQYKKHQETIQREKQEILASIKEKQSALDKEKSKAKQLTDHLNDKERDLTERLEAVKALKERRQNLVEELNGKLESIAKMTQQEAEKELMDNVERRSREQAGRLIKSMEEKAKKAGNRKAKEIVLAAIENLAVETVTSHTTATVSLPDDEMKGRIIGKEGRNIRAFEASIGVDVIVDDTPGVVILSCFDPIRRELGRLTLEALVEDGRIHPTRIEECIEKAREQINETIQQKGEDAADQLGLEFHPKIIENLGRLHYRTSYGQNILHHSLESAKIAGRIAHELGVNVNLAKRGTILHDIGKAIDFEQEGSHDDLGADLCRKYGESEELINCIMAHHEDEAPETVEAVIVKMADAISSVRPGARKESVELYLKRLEALESLAMSFEGVEKAYAIQAGRELRVLVRPEDINDDGMPKVAQDIAVEIEKELDYPGEVKVSVVRETRASSIAH